MREQSIASPKESIAAEAVFLAVEAHVPGSYDICRGAAPPLTNDICKHFVLPLLLLG